MNYLLILTEQILVSSGAVARLNMGKLILKVRAEKLPNMDLFSKSDPYLCVYIVKARRGTRLQTFEQPLIPLNLWKIINKSFKKFFIMNY